MWSMPLRNICCRKSGPQSINMFLSPTVRHTDERSRLSRGSADRHTSQEQPIMGTPVDVPVPKNSICILLYVIYFGR